MTVHQFIDRRRNPRDKSLGNRQRFMKRARAQIKKVIDRTISENNIADVADAKKISIKGSSGLSEEEIERTLAISHSHLSLDAPMTPGEDNRLLDSLPDQLSSGPDDEAFP